jgi:pimeloyl-ACP methyl ester carboxylesterase
VATTATFREGSGEPLVVLHIGANPWKKWENCLPSLTERYDVFIPTYAGFEGGPPLPGPATIALLADGVESEMSKAGIQTAHIVGNSLGGWLAMELARRGRARSAIALSPGGGWTTPWQRLRIRLFFRLTSASNRIMGSLKPVLLRHATFRRLALRAVVEHGERVTLPQAIAISEDSMKGDLPRLLPVANDTVQAFADPGVPTLVVWGEKDRLTRLHPDGDVWRQATPHAEWYVMPGVGHLPMFDDPEATTKVVLDFLVKAEAS